VEKENQERARVPNRTSVCNMTMPDHVAKRTKKAFGVGMENSSASLLIRHCFF